jgi:hypothetical protein
MQRFGRCSGHPLGRVAALFLLLYDPQNLLVYVWKQLPEPATFGQKNIFSRPDRGICGNGLVESWIYS